MFEDGLLESGGLIRTQQKWTTTFSLLIQIVVIAFVALFPLVSTQVLPATQLRALLVAPPPSPQPALQVQRVQGVSGNSEMLTPSTIPPNIQTIGTRLIGPLDTPPSPIGVISDPSFDRALDIRIVNFNPPPAKAATTPVQKLRVSEGVAEGNLLRRVEPQYPSLAKIIHAQGDVVLQATISKSGAIENLRSISGHPMLLQAAMDAVKQWQYRPTLLNGEPVEVETSITVRFRM